MADPTVQWDGLEAMKARIEEYGRRCHQAVIAVCVYIAPIIETYAKQNARWTDRTSNARQGLNAFVQEISQDIVRIYLAGGVDYQIWLEVRWAGKYAIIWESLQAHFDTITKMLQDIFR